MKALFSPLNIAAMILFAAALAWRVFQLRRSPRSLPPWAVTVTITCVAASFLFQQQVLATAVDEAFGRGAARLLMNVLLSIGVCSLLVFFLGSALGERPYRRAAFELLPLAAVIALMVVALAITPPEVRGASLSPARVHLPGVALFYLGAGLYLIYGMVSCVRWMLRYLRAADRHLRVGLRIGAIGLGSAALGSILRALYIVIAWAFGPSVPTLLAIAVPLVILGTVGFLVGICYPGLRARLSAIGRRRQHQRHYQELHPLWTLLVTAFPTIVLREGRPRPLDRFRARAVTRRYYRRVIEIRDGLVQLSPYLGADLTALAEDDPPGAAAELRASLDRQAEGGESDHKARLVLPGGGTDLDADVRPLLALSRAVSTA
ncbi:MAB_1171c family putative transporter [Amycolatopsis nigrescens]|uniref:MAB_1171c family putative transporter n=1 Tax=Amycolatopsis nigrescens TaxID=381445 RepID=UPI0003675948|nr:MAB_1171c family putative transporter [Amycolatopsis nigrescens]